MLSEHTTEAYALSLDKCDAAFTTAINEFLGKQGFGSQRINAEKEIIYDIDLNELGVCYSFLVDNESGYAIVVEQGNDCLISECYFDSENPFSDSTGKNVYVSPFCYLEYREGNYYEIGKSDLLSRETVQELSANAYRGSITFIYTSETINYLYRSDNTYKLARKHPQYVGIQSLSSGYAVVAGGNIIGYYDRNCTALIPNYTPGSNTASGYIYKNQSTEVNAMITQLYSDMGTTVLGTTYMQFKNGMTKYCEDAGYDISFTSCMSNGSFNYATAKAQLNLNKPIAIFSSSYNIAAISLNTNQDAVDYVSVVGNHVMAGFGYLEVTYTYSDYSTKVYRYIEVASGLSERKAEYFNIDYNASILYADAINIY